MAYVEQKKKRSKPWQDGDEIKTVDQEKAEVPKTSKQQFKMDSSGFLVSKTNANLVLGTAKGAKIESGAKILIQAKSHDEPGQLWRVSGSTIECVFDSSLVFAIRAGSLVLETKSNSENGAAHQKFKIDKFGGIKGFEAEEIDRELTACIQTGICTFSVTGDEETDQMGFL